RDGKKQTFEIVPRVKTPKGKGKLGVIITTPFIEKKYSILEAPFFGLIQSFQITKKIVVELTKTLIQFLTLQKPSAEVSGPIGIAQYTSRIVKFGKNAILELLALLSLNLAVINIFPFPALDGGRLVFALYEWVTRKRVDQQFERTLNFIGIVILLTLAGLVTINDIIKIYR
ncbi:site-2 protease family protein, partial [Candidatus Roizmanbacteria bacterium]|nr:site-2 protease family protein [Candidatus Roizmanbacteria bacterium]